VGPVDAPLRDVMTIYSSLPDPDPPADLPAQLREEMINVFKEGPLPSAEELIRRYYLSVNKKSTSREE